MMARARRRRAISRAIGGLAFLAIGGTTAAALSLAGRTKKAHVAAHTAPAASVRIPVPPEALRRAYAAGSIDRPIKSILNVPARMHYGDFRWDDKGVPAGPLWVRVDLSAQIISI